MGRGVRPVQAPNGQWMDPTGYQQYMRDVYQPQQDFAASANTPIPGVTGPASMIPGPVPGGPPPQQIPGPKMPMNNFMASGPYGQQAMQMAGLLGNVPSPQQPTTGYNGLLGGPKGGFRIPGGK